MTKSPTEKWFFLLWTLLWGIWITLLLIYLATSEFNRDIFFFYDYRYLQDVSSQYTYLPTTMRYILEPMYGLSNFFITSTEGILVVFGFYFLIRITFGILDKRYYHKKLAEKPILRTLERFAGLYASLLFGLVFLTILIILIGFLISGFLFIAYYAMSMVYVIHWILNIIMLVVILGFLYYNHNPKKAFRHRLDHMFERWAMLKTRSRFYNLIKNRQFIKNMIRELRRVLIYAAFFIFIILNCLFFPNPTRQLQTDLAPNEVLFDFHIHTIRSDGFITPAQRVEWYRSNGIQGAAFTDHSGIEGAVEAEKYVHDNNLDFTVIIGQEYTPSEPRTHLNIYGLRENINPYVYYPGIRMDYEIMSGTSKFMNVSEMIQYVKANGGYVTVNHYSSSSPYSWEDYRRWGVDGFEIVTSGGIRSLELREYCLNHSLILIGGEDHADSRDMDTFLRIKLDDPTNRSVDAIFAALRRNEHEIVSIQMITPPSGPFGEILPDFDRYYGNLDFYQQLSWIIWSIGLYLVGIGGIIYIRKVGQHQKVE